jgi:hypothetical protein
MTPTDAATAAPRAVTPPERWAEARIPLDDAGEHGS